MDFTLKHKDEMKHARFFTILFLLACALAVPAQTFQLKVGGGLSSQSAGKKAQGAYKFGVGYEYEFNQHWAFNPSLVFYGKGWKYKDVLVNIYDDEGNQVYDEEGNPVMGLMGRSATAHYIELPLLMNYYYRVGESRYLVAGAGPYVACGVGGKLKTNGDGAKQGPDKLFYENPTFEVEGARRWDAGIQAMVGYQLPVGIVVGLEADFGLTRFSAAGGRNISGLISFTYNFK